MHEHERGWHGGPRGLIGPPGSPDDAADAAGAPLHFADGSIAYHRDKHARALGVNVSTSYLVTAVWADQYQPTRHGKERKGIRQDLGVIEHHWSPYRWPARCLACPATFDAATRVAAGRQLAQHHETHHPRRSQ